MTGMIDLEEYSKIGITLPTNLLVKTYRLGHNFIQLFDNFVHHRLSLDILRYVIYGCNIYLVNYFMWKRLVQEAKIVGLG